PRRLRASPRGVHDIAFPPAGRKQLRRDLWQRDRKGRLQQIVCDLANRLRASPAVELFGSTIPEGDHVLLVTYEDRIVREVKQPHLALQPLLCLTPFDR